MQNRVKGIPRPGKIANECLAVLLDEVQQAVAWSRHSILLAVHQSKDDQTNTINVLRDMLENLQIQVDNIVPENGKWNILSNITQRSNLHETIFFINGLGSEPQIYDGLNIFREVIVEQQLKLILWLTVDEMVLISRRAPDFWAFRHRVIEFPTKRSSRKNILPSGVLLWHRRIINFDLDNVRNNITYHEKLLKNLPVQRETRATIADVIGNLAHYYWVAGEDQEVLKLVDQAQELFGQVELNDLNSMLMNIQAIHCFDHQEYTDSLRWIEKALEINKTQSMLWTNYGVICRSAGQAKKSLSSLQKAVKLDPNAFESWAVMGYIYMALGKYSSAFPLFEKAIAIHPESLHFHPALAICFSRAGRLDDLSNTILQITDAAKEDGYLAACLEGLLGNESAAFERLKQLVSDEKIPSSFVRRDPNLHFILNNVRLQEVL
jgi:tetratricopeptide (TPR) repeat protein